MRRAISVAEKAGVPYRAAEARMTLVVILADRGNTDGALAEAALADSVLTGAGPGPAAGESGDGAGPHRAHRRGAGGVRREPAGPAGRRRRPWEALLVNMRGIIHAMQGPDREAIADLLRGEELTADDGYRLLQRDHPAEPGLGGAA